jgi:GTP-binding protein
VHIVSAVAHQGLKELTFALAAHVRRAREEQVVVEPTRVVLRPKAIDDSGFEIRRENTPDGEVFRVVGDRPARWVSQTDFANDEAVGYLADRLNRLGVEEALVKAGAVAGSTVLIGAADDAVVFDWEPTMSSGAELLGARGSDLRLDERRRPTRSEKRDAFHGKMDAAAAARAEMEAERRAGRWTDPE